MKLKQIIFSTVITLMFSSAAFCKYSCRDGDYNIIKKPDMPKVGKFKCDSSGKCGQIEYKE